MILGLHHVQITITEGSEAKAKEFYCDVLGLVEIEKPEILKEYDWFLLQSNNLEVHIGVEEGFDRTTTKAHLAYLVYDIAYWKNTLQQNDIKILESVPIPNYERFEFRNPFGNRVEMIQAK